MPAVESQVNGSARRRITPKNVKHVEAVALTGPLMPGDSWTLELRVGERWQAFLLDARQVAALVGCGVPGGVS